MKAATAKLVLLATITALASVLPPIIYDAHVNRPEDTSILNDDSIDIPTAAPAGLLVGGGAGLDGLLCAFFENSGQLTDGAFFFYSSAGGVQFRFGQAAVILVMPVAGLDGPATVRLTFPGGNEITPIGRDRLDYTSNFFLGNDATSWRTGIRSFREIAYIGLFEGIDLIYRIGPDGLKYDLNVAPGADPDRIKMAYEGIDSIMLGPDGGLKIQAGALRISDPSPKAWSADGTLVPCSFRMRGPSSFGFLCGPYDGTKGLVIDPLLYATYLGGSDHESNPQIALDSDDYIYVAGATYSTDIPTTSGVYQESHDFQRSLDIFIVKLAPSGDKIIFATYIGGLGNEGVNDFILDDARNLYLTGSTSSWDFPTTSGSFQPDTTRTTDAFVCMLDSSGSSLVFSTYLGGEDIDEGLGIGLDTSKNVYVAGDTQSPDFKVTSGTFQTTLKGATDIFVVKLSSDGSDLLYGSFIGGSKVDYMCGMVLDDSGIAYLAGRTDSNDFPTTPGAYQTASAGRTEAFALGMNSSGTGLVFSTLLGGSGGEDSYGMDLDLMGNIYIVGKTNSSDFPVTDGAFQTSFASERANFVAKLNNDGTGLNYSTCLGGGVYDWFNEISVDASGNAYIIGTTESKDFPVTPGTIQASRAGMADAVLVELNETGGCLVFSTYFGGRDDELAGDIALDSSESPVIVGETDSTNLPVTPGAFCQTYDGETDVFLAKIDIEPYMLTVDTEPRGLEVVIDGKNHTAPCNLWCGGDSPISLGTAALQEGNGSRYLFQRWSDGGGRTHTFTCDADMIFTAFFDTQHLFAVRTYPPGLNVTIDGMVRATPLDGPLTEWWDAASTHTISTASPQTADASTRYAFRDWSDGGERTHDVLMDGPLNITVNFTAQYRVEVGTDPQGLNLTIDGIERQGPFADWWNESSTHTVVAAEVAPLDQDSRYSFKRWDDWSARERTVTILRPMSLLASYQRQYRIQISTNPLALNVTVDYVGHATPLIEWWDAQSTHVLSVPSPQQVAPALRYNFTRWSDDGLQTHRVVANGPDEILAMFGQQYLVTFETEPTGLAVTLEGTDHATPYAIWWDSGSQHLVSAFSPQYPAQTVRCEFSSWSDGGDLSHVVLADAPVSLTAAFTQWYRISVGTNPSGLNVTVDGIDRLTPLVEWWEVGSTHAVSGSFPDTAEPDERYALANWSDGGAIAHTIRADGSIDLLAGFVIQYHVILRTSPSDLDLTMDGEVHATPYSAWWNVSSEHTVMAPSQWVSGANTRFMFKDWSDGGDQAHALEPISPMTLTANYTKEFLIVVRSVPSSLAIRTDGSWFRTPCEFWWANGSSHELGVNTSQEGLEFKRWSDGGGISHLYAVSGPCELTVSYATPSIMLDVLVPTDGQTVRGSIRLYGNASAGAAIQLRVDNGAWMDVATSSSNGSWSRDWASTVLANGEHALEFKAVLGESESTIARRVVMIDNPRPSEDGNSLPLMVVIILVILVLLIVAILVMRRRRRQVSGTPHEMKPGPQDQAPGDDEG